MNLDAEQSQSDCDFANGGPMDAEEFVRLWDADAMTIECVEPGGWIQEYKGQYKESVWKHIPTDSYWEVIQTRYGSVFSDFEYEPPEVRQVKPYVEVVEVIKYASI